MRIGRDVVGVTGPDATSFLQGQLSQDVASIATGSSAWALVLEPQGKVDAFVRVTRDGADGFRLDTDAGFGEAVVARLDRFKLRVKADIEFLGRAAVEADPDVDPTVALSAFGPITTGTDAPSRGWEEGWEPARIELGIPAMGRELTPDTIPEEAGLVDVAVSFTKGCYTGQELVARIDSRGRNVPRRLRRIEADGALSVGDQLVAAGKVVGTVTSTTGSLGLGYVARSVEPPALVDAPSGVARIVALPPLR